jgi:hypothetical protein
MNRRVANCYTVPRAWNYKSHEIMDGKMGVPCSAYGGGRGAYRVLLGKPRGRGPLATPRRRQTEMRNVSQRNKI